jgi:hypothetical protein
MNVFSQYYWSVGSHHKEHIGKPFKVIRELKDNEYDKESVDTMYLIKFEDGKEIAAYSYEVIESDVDELKKEIIKKGYKIKDVKGSRNIIC